MELLNVDVIVDVRNSMETVEDGYLKFKTKEGFEFMKENLKNYTAVDVGSVSGEEHTEDKNFNDRRAVYANGIDWEDYEYILVLDSELRKHVEADIEAAPVSIEHSGSSAYVLTDLAFDGDDLQYYEQKLQSFEYIETDAAVASNFGYKYCYTFHEHEYSEV